MVRKHFITDNDMPYIAKEDLVCYKILAIRNESLLTPYMRIPVELEVCYNTNDESQEIEFDWGNFALGGGFLYAYTSIEIAYEILKSRKENRAVFLGVIPKGSEFYVSIDHKQVCSNQMIYKLM